MNTGAAAGSGARLEPGEQGVGVLWGVTSQHDADEKDLSGMCAGLSHHYRHRHRLDGSRVDIVPVPDDEVFRSPDEAHESLSVDRSSIAGDEPAVENRSRGISCPTLCEWRLSIQERRTAL